MFEAAHKGTIFLDEIGDMSPETQSKLLRVLETNTFTKVGDTKITNIDVRVISATNKDLKSQIEKIFLKTIFITDSILLLYTFPL